MTLEEAVLGLLDKHGSPADIMDYHEVASDLRQRIERYGAALHCRGGWPLGQAQVKAIAAFIGDTPKEKK